MDDLRPTMTNGGHCSLVETDARRACIIIDIRALEPCGSRLSSAAVRAGAICGLAAPTSPLPSRRTEVIQALTNCSHAAHELNCNNSPRLIVADTRSNHDQS